MMSNINDPKCGFVAIAGAPNVGKSTLINALVGQRIALTSPKPQSSRLKVSGIVTRGNAQLIIVDTPGLLDSNQPLQHALQLEASRVMNEADVVLHVSAADRPITLRAHLQTLTLAPPPPAVRVIEVINKIDSTDEAAADDLRRLNPHAVLVSALHGQMIDELLDRLVEAVLPGPWLHDPSDLTVQSSRFLVGELVRESIFELTHQELPYSVHIDIEEFREGQSPIYMRAVAYVERESQKGILLGAGGRTIREIGQSARRKIEALVGGQVYLDLWVKVAPNWRRDPDALRRFGFPSFREKP
ncbi:MAG: GTPase Era [Gemmatimonadota bacterium]